MNDFPAVVPPEHEEALLLPVFKDVNKKQSAHHGAGDAVTLTRMDKQNERQHIEP